MQTASAPLSTLSLTLSLPLTLKARAKVSDSEIESIYAVYPKHVGKAAALTSIRKALAKIEADDLLTAVREFATATKGTETRFIPHCATWMNQQRWTDDRSEWRAQSAGRPISPGVKYDPAASNGRPVATEGLF